MKKYIVAAVALSAALSVLAQGTVNFSTRVTGTVVGHVYNVETPDPGVIKFGNTATETPGGTQTYTGAFLTGSGWSAQLWAFNGAGALESSLAAVSPVSTFRTGSTLGGTPVPIVATCTGVGAVPAAGTGTFQVRVWNNVGGTLTTWAAAETEWLKGSIAAGKSGLFTISNLGDGALNLPADMANFRSFNVYTIVPEPSTFALLGLGALGMLIFRRK